MRLEGRKALVTGGAVRIGRALSLALANAGCDILVHCHRSAAEAVEVQAAARDLGVAAETCSADLADSEAARGLVTTAVEKFGQLDILINSAALFPDGDSFTDTSPALWDELFAVNLRAPFVLSQAFARQLGERQQGRIINILDARVRHHQTDHFAYRLSKGALWQMTRMQARELAPKTTVNGIALGAVLPPPGQDYAYLEALAASQIPLRRPGGPEDVARNAVHLLAEDFITGAVLELDGGQFL